MLILTLLTLLGAVSAAPAVSGSACSKFRSSITANSQAAAATSYCASVLSVGTHTSTATATITSTARVTSTTTLSKMTTQPTVTVTKTGRRVTTTITSYSVASVSTYYNISTAYESASYITVYSQCPSPAGVTKRTPEPLQAATTTTSSAQTFPSNLCNCLLIPHPQTTTTTTTTSVVTVISERTTRTTATLSPTETTTKRATVTATTTVATTSTTTINTAVTPTYTNNQFYLYTDTSQWMVVASNPSNQEVVILLPQWGANAFTLTGTTLGWNYNFNGTGLSTGPTSDQVVFAYHTDANANLMTCNIDYANSCKLSCSVPSSTGAILSTNVVDQSGQWALTDGTGTESPFFVYVSNSVAN